MTEIDMKGLDSRERKIVRRKHGLVAEQGVWRISTNQELKNYVCPDVVTY
jgi:hypothetical protein